MYVHRGNLLFLIRSVEEDRFMLYKLNRPFGYLMAEHFPVSSAQSSILKRTRVRRNRFTGQRIAGFDLKKLDAYNGSPLQVLILALVASAVVVLFTYPKYMELLLDTNLAERYSYFFHKIDAPLSPVHTVLEQHSSKIDFRLTVPLLARLLNISGKDHGIIIIYLIQSAMLIPFFYVLIQFMRRYMTNTSVLFFLIGSSSVYLSQAFIWDYDFWFDGYAYCFLLLGMYFHSRPAIFLTLQLACWTDERAVVALSSIYLFHLLAENKFDVRSMGQIIRGDFIQKQVFGGGAGGCFLPGSPGASFSEIRSADTHGRRFRRGAQPHSLSAEAPAFWYFLRI
jgi:hypothetical protein